MSAITNPILLDSTGQEIVEALEAIAENMGTSAGHTIQNDTGTDMQRRDKLQFKGVYVEDNQANDVTKVDIVREFQSKSAIEALTGEEAKGFQYLDDDVYDAFTASDIGFDNSDTSFTGNDVQEVLEEIDEVTELTITGKVTDIEGQHFVKNGIAYFYGSMRVNQNLTSGFLGTFNKSIYNQGIGQWIGYNVSRSNSLIGGYLSNNQIIYNVGTIQNGDTITMFTTFRVEP